jgi:hypothetical protein
VKRFALLAAKIAVTVTLLWFALRGVELSLLGADVARAHTGTLVLAVLVLALQPLLGALRWHVIMRELGAPVTLAQSGRITYASTFLSQVVPGGAGDALRMWLSFREGHGLAHALNGVALDRVVSLAILMAVAALGLAALEGYPQLSALEHSLVPLAVAAFLGVGVLLLLDRLPASLRRFRAAQGLAALARDARRLMLSPRAAPLVTALALLGIANLCASLCLLMLAFNVPLEPRLLAAAVPPVILASSLPVSVGGWGTREAAVVVMFGALAAPAEPGIVASIAFGLASILVSLPGVFFLYPAAAVPRS